MHFQKLFFIPGFICSVILPLCAVDAMDHTLEDQRFQGRKHPLFSNDDSLVKDENSAGTASPSYSSSEYDSNNDSECSQYESDGGYSENQVGNAPKRLRWTSYLTANVNDPFLREFETGVYVRAHMKLDGSFDEHPKGTTYMPLADVEKIEWNWLLSLNDCVLLSRGMSPKVRWLNLAGCNLTELSLGWLESAVRARPTLQELRISEGIENCFSSGGICHLVSLVTHSPNLRVIDVNNKAIDNTTVQMVFGTLVGRQNSLDVLDLGWSITFNGLSHALSLLDSIPSLIKQECSLCMAIGDYRMLDSNVIERVLGKNSTLELSFTFGRGSLVNVASLDAIKAKYKTNDRYRFDFDVTP